MKTNHQINFMQQSALIVVNPNIGYSYGFLFNSNMLFKTQTQGQWFGACSLSFTWPFLAKPEIFFSSGYQFVMSVFCFIIVC